MVSIRRFTCRDLFKFDSVNLDFFTETYNVLFYLQYLARWPEYCMMAESVGNERTGYILGKVEGEGKSWHGHVTAVTVGPMYRRQGIARIALSYDRALRPGGFANATIRSGAISAPVLPESAVQSDTNGNFVYIVGPGNKVERRGVEVGAVTDEGLTIASGLSGRELVVVYAGGFLNPGEVVQPRRQKGIARQTATDSEPASTSAGAE